MLVRPRDGMTRVTTRGRESPAVKTGAAREVTPGDDAADGGGDALAAGLGADLGDAGAGGVGQEVLLRSDSTPRRRMAGPRSYLPELGDWATRPTLARLTR
ncbi:hypothetical protein WQ59_02640 [Streptomyces sp. KE1]|nr:hypothetical protein WQ59_02640 [Streptomyces sp. KE1]